MVSPLVEQAQAERTDWRISMSTLFPSSLRERALNGKEISFRQNYPLESSKKNGVPIAPVLEHPLLASLPASDQAALLRNAQLTSLKQGQILQHPGEDITQIYIPLRAVSVLSTPLTDGRAGEVMVIGNTGIVGAQALLGDVASSIQVMVVVPGLAWRLSVDAFRLACQCHGALRNLIHRYLLFQFSEILQSVACNKLHTLDQRLSRWLLTLNDCQIEGSLPVTHEFLSHLLGVRRAGITKALQDLASNHLLSRHRRRISILDYPGLAARACECYSVIGKERAILMESNSWREKQ